MEVSTNWEDAHWQDEGSWDWPPCRGCSPRQPRLSSLPGGSWPPPATQGSCSVASNSQKALLAEEQTAKERHCPRLPGTALLTVKRESRFIQLSSSWQGILKPSTSPGVMWSLLRACYPPAPFLGGSCRFDIGAVLNTHGGLCCTTENLKVSVP